MEFFKKHYEKVLLSVVLLGLGAAAYWLPLAVQDAVARSKVAGDPPQKGGAIPDVAFTNELAALKAMTNPPTLQFSGEHRVISPATWKKMPDGTVKKFLAEGPEALVIKNIRPLLTSITFDRAASSGFYINVQQQSKQSKTAEYLKPNEKSKSGLFVLREAKGNADDPSELVIEMVEGQAMVTLQKGQPKQTVDGYTVDLRYDPENANFGGKRAGESITFGGGTYKIVYIGSNEVRVTDQTGKQTTIPWTGTGTQ